MEKRYFKIETQEINLQEINLTGKILDIGGGGEGVIGLLQGEKVVAIDRSKEELEEAPAGPLKIVMDARELKFLDDTFDTITIFFTSMYVKRKERIKVFAEAYRVLKPGGKLYFWDVLIPPFPGGEKDIFVVPVEILLPDKKISTGYGTLWPNNEQDLAYYKNLGQEVGFEVIITKAKNQNFYLCFQKS